MKKTFVGTFYLWLALTFALGSSESIAKGNLDFLNLSDVLSHKPSARTTESLYSEQMRAAFTKGETFNEQVLNQLIFKFQNIFEVNYPYDNFAVEFRLSQDGITFGGTLSLFLNHKTAPNPYSITFWDLSGSVIDYTNNPQGLRLFLEEQYIFPSRLVVGKTYEISRKDRAFLQTAEFLSMYSVIIPEDATVKLNTGEFNDLSNINELGCTQNFALWVNDRVVFEVHNAKYGSFQETRMQLNWGDEKFSWSPRDEAEEEAISKVLDSIFSEENKYYENVLPNELFVNHD